MSTPPSCIQHADSIPATYIFKYFCVCPAILRLQVGDALISIPFLSLQYAASHLKELRSKFIVLTEL